MTAVPWLAVAVQPGNRTVAVLEPGLEVETRQRRRVFGLDSVQPVGVQP
jgi:hypothetical protein